MSNFWVEEGEDGRFYVYSRTLLEEVFEDRIEALDFLAELESYHAQNETRNDW